ncbi:MAG: preprotein translocase subunit SecE [Alphaproteobacteria bacterium]
MINPVEFVQQVKREISKVSWPSQKEVVLTTVMVFILVMIAATFFLLVDNILIRIVKFILGLGA